jgi:predicted DNA-binding transcriptional regulator YafY
MDNLLDRLEELARIHDLIRRRATGDPAALARRLGLSRATVFRRILDLRDMGAEIGYDKEKPAYYCERPFQLERLKKILVSLTE